MKNDNFLIIGLMGESGSGKNLCGDWMVKNKGLVALSFADVFKRFCRDIFGFSDESLWGAAPLRNTEVIPHDFTGAQAEKAWDMVKEKIDEHGKDFAYHLCLGPKEATDYVKLLKGFYEDVRERTNSGKISPRLALQLLGTEYGRSFKDDIWLSCFYKYYVSEIKKGGRYTSNRGIVGYDSNNVATGIVITDLRFKNELKLMKKHGDFVIKIVRLSLLGQANEAEKAGIKGHASETELRSIPDEDFDLILRFEEGIDNVYARLEVMWNNKEWES